MEKADNRSIEFPQVENLPMASSSGAGAARPKKTVFLIDDLIGQSGDDIQKICRHMKRTIRWNATRNLLALHYFAGYLGNKGVTTLDGIAESPSILNCFFARLDKEVAISEDEKKRYRAEIRYFLREACGVEMTKRTVWYRSAGGAAQGVVVSSDAANDETPPVKEAAREICATAPKGGFYGIDLNIGKTEPDAGKFFPTEEQAMALMHLVEWLGKTFYGKKIPESFNVSAAKGDKAALGRVRFVQKFFNTSLYPSLVAIGVCCETKYVAPSSGDRQNHFTPEFVAAFNDPAGRQNLANWMKNYRAERKRRAQAQYSQRAATPGLG